MRLFDDPPLAFPSSPRDFSVREVNEATAIALYTRYHYLGDQPVIATVHFGAFYHDACLGALSFGPPNAKEMKGYFNRATQAGWFEIKRLVFHDECPKNSASWMIAASLKILRAMFRVRGIVTLADSGVGHTGAIYRASNFTYVGLSAPKNDYLLPDGTFKQRGKVRDLGGSWVERSRKHVYVKVYEDVA